MVEKVQLAEVRFAGAAQQELMRDNIKYPYYFKVRKRKGLRDAWDKVYKNGLTSQSEITRREIKEFSINVENKIERVYRKLKDNTFNFSPSRGIPISREGKTPRPLVKAPIKSRIVQRRILDILQEVPAIKIYLEIETSFGSIKDRSVKDAIKYACEKIELIDNAYYIRTDIEGFFTGIQRGAVIEHIEKHIKDKHFIDLLKEATKTELENIGDLGKYIDLFPDHSIGVAQGCCLSPLMGNILLNDFDQKMNGRGIACLRYVDDILILGPDRKKCFAAFRSAQKELKEYGLKVYKPVERKSRFHNEKAQCGEVKNGIYFLGCEITPGLIRPNKKSRNKLLDNVRNIFKNGKKLMSKPNLPIKKRSSFIETLTEVSNVLKGWGNQYSYCNDKLVLQSLDQKIDKEIAGFISYYSAKHKEFSRRNTKIARRRLLGVHALTDSKSDPILPLPSDINKTV